MAENVLKLKKRAVSLGMDRSEAKTANRSRLEAFITRAEKGGSKVTKKKTVAKKNSGTAGKPVRKPARKTTRSAPAARKSAPASKPKTGKAKRRSVSDSGRELIGTLNFSRTDGWNPRKGSPVETIFKALKRAKGNVEKAVDSLMPEIKSLVSTTKADGTRRTKAEMRALLKYRVNRTKWEFATRTGQHEASENRIEYGTGPYAQPVKPVKAKKATRKPTPKRSALKRKAGRPVSRKTKKAAARR